VNDRPGTSLAAPSNLLLVKIKKVAAWKNAFGKAPNNNIVKNTYFNISWRFEFRKVSMRQMLLFINTINEGISKGIEHLPQMQIF